MLLVEFWVLVDCAKPEEWYCNPGNRESSNRGKAGKIDFKVDKFGIIHASIGKVTFEPNKIMENAREFLNVINKLKPAAAKGTYIKSVYLSSTMSPGIQVDQKTLLD